MCVRARSDWMTLNEAPPWSVWRFFIALSLIIEMNVKRLIPRHQLEGQFRLDCSEKTPEGHGTGHFLNVATLILLFFFSRVMNREQVPLRHAHQQRLRQQR